jgi:hypothetical protein
LEAGRPVNPQKATGLPKASPSPST